MAVTFYILYMKKTIFEDKDGNEMSLFINIYGLLYIKVGVPDDGYFQGYICLDKEDVYCLIKNLKTHLSEM